MSEVGDLRAEIVTSSPEETEAIAARLAARLRAGDVVYVSGDLGAGKTTFVRGACRALGVGGPVTSPTYTIGHRYDGVSHLDLFRFERLTDADWGALEPYFEDAIVFVEWPERAGGRLPPARVTVQLAHADERRRSIALSSDEAHLLAGLV
jgi:tRNA threonylcarbamoyladenosine biosynthesis protein TsaE